MTRDQVSNGTRVAYSRAFLRSIGAFSGPLPFKRGTVTLIDARYPEFTLIHILWDDGSKGKVNIKNLVREDRIHLEPV